MIPLDNVIRVRGRWSRAGDGPQPRNVGDYTSADFNSPEYEDCIIRHNDGVDTGYIVQRSGLYLVSATLMLDHDSALDPVTIRFVDVEQPDPVLRRWTIFPLVKNYVSCAVSAVLPIETNCRLKVQWDGANELVSRDFYGQDVSWLEITRLGSVWFKSSKVSMLIE